MIQQCITRNQKYIVPKKYLKLTLFKSNQYYSITNLNNNVIIITKQNNRGFMLYSKALLMLRHNILQLIILSMAKQLPTLNDIIIENKDDLNMVHKHIKQYGRIIIMIFMNGF